MDVELHCRETLNPLYFAHEREVAWRNNLDSRFGVLKRDEREEIVKRIRFRTPGDITITGGLNPMPILWRKSYKWRDETDRTRERQMTNAETAWKKNKDIFKEI